MDIAQFADVAIFGSAMVVGFGMMLKHLLERNKQLGVRLDELVNRAAVVDMARARAIRLTAIRRVRDIEIANLDVPFMKALEDGDTDAQATIKVKKQVLRDIPQTFDLTTDTPEQLKSKWPDELPR